MTYAKWLAYCRLMRLNKPIGALLLLWPTLWALWLAGNTAPHGFILLVFTLGVFLMRAAGCVINDFADRHFDGHVTRTRLRPLPSGEITTKEAKCLFVLLISLAFALVLLLNTLTILLSVAALLLAWIYPFMKRVTSIPQVVLGLAFGWSIPMAYAAVSNDLPPHCWLLFLANICWTVAYDTEYAMVDREDDLKIGVKSTAILFGRHDKIIIAFLQGVTVLLLAGLGYLYQLSYPFYLSLLLVSLLFVYQQRLLVDRQPSDCFRAFMNNNYVGLLLFAGIVLSQ